MANISMMDSNNSEKKEKKETLEEQKKKINDILCECWFTHEGCDAVDDNEKVKRVFKMIEKYINDGNKFLYSIVSTSIYRLEDQEEETLQNFIELLVSYVEENDELKISTTGKAIVKLWDHINLALAQELYIENKQGDISNYTSCLEERVSSLDSEIWKMTTKVDSIMTQMISIVSIFTAISFVVFGGITSFQSIFTNLEGISMSKLMIVGCIWALALVNLLFLFIYYMAKLTKINIKTNCLYKANMVQRYPLIIYIDAMLISIFILSLWVKFIEVTLGLNIIVSFINSRGWIIIIGTIVLIFTLFMLWVFIIKWTDKKSS